MGLIYLFLDYLEANGLKVCQARANYQHEGMMGEARKPFSSCYHPLLNISLLHFTFFTVASNPHPP